MNAFPWWFRVFVLLAAGGLVVTAAPPLLEALAAPGVPAMWWAARAFGLLAYVALWLSALFGVLLAGRGAGGLFDRATVLELHNHWALAALVATALHVLAVVGDPHSGVGPLAAALPLASAKLRGPVALGTFALWGMIAVAVTTAAMRALPPFVWRAVHATAFGTLVLALVHGATAGSESGTALARGLYAGTTAVLLGAVLQRLALAARRPATTGRDPTR
jgi:sulfoxide reductase heme-binding subunit YedZ